MTTHPLTSEDYHLIQDYMITKVIFLLASRADLAEWQHEIDALETQSGDYWQRRNQLLLDYTLGRFLAASAADEDADDKPPAPIERFLFDFTAAVERQDYVTAETLWAEANQPTSGSETRQSSTTHLILRLNRLVHRLDVPATLAALPPEFHPPQYAS